MTTEERLRAALESRAATARRSPDALPEIRRRAGHRRWVARGQVALATAAVAGVVVAAGALATSGGSEPSPPVTTTTPAPSPTVPGPSVRPSASPSPTVGPDQYVALQEGGELVVASATDGRVAWIVDVVRVTAGARYDLDLAPDRAAVYLTEPGPDTCERDGSVARYDVATGERTEVGRGHALSVSPDGTRLAYVADPCAGGTVEVLDLATGQTTRYANTQRTPDDPAYTGPWNAHEVVWHADGRRLWVVMEWELVTDLRLLDPATDRDLKDVTSVRTQHTTFGLERRADGLVYLHVCCYPEPEEPSSVVVRDAAGRERKVVTSPASGELTAAVAGPDGDLLYTQSGRVYRLDLDSGATTDLGSSTAVARDW